MCLPLSWVMEQFGNCNLLWAGMGGWGHSSAAKHSLSAGNQGSRVDFLGFTAWEWLWGKSLWFSHAHCPLHRWFPARLERSSAKPKILIRDSSAIQNHAEKPPRFTKFSHWHRQHWPPHSWCCMPFVFPLSPSGWWKESRDVHFDGGELLALQQGK